MLLFLTFPFFFLTSMRRDFIINILLIIAGIVLALVLFGAGAMWRSTLKGGGLGSERQEQMGGGQSRS